MTVSDPSEYRSDDFTTPAAPPSLTKQWQTWIGRAIARAERSMIRACMSAVGEALIKEREAMRKEYRDALDREVAALRNEFLADKLAEERAKRTFPRPVSPPGSMIA
jgi:hypothetical protein